MCLQLTKARTRFSDAMEYARRRHCDKYGRGRRRAAWKTARLSRAFAADAEVVIRKQSEVRGRWCPCFRSCATLVRMSVIRARVVNGRLQVDAPTSLPEGTVLNLVVDDEGDDLDATERAALNSAISRAWASTQAGTGRPAADVLASLRKR